MAYRCFKLRLYIDLRALGFGVGGCPGSRTAVQEMPKQPISISWGLCPKSYLDPQYGFEVYSPIKGYWAFWVPVPKPTAHCRSWLLPRRWLVWESGVKGVGVKCLGVKGFRL